MEPCVDAKSSARGSVLTRFLDSPVFQNTAFTFNGVDVGTTQYLDAFQRANFSTIIGGRPYHVLVSSDGAGARHDRCPGAVRLRPFEHFRPNLRLLRSGRGC